MDKIYSDKVVEKWLEMKKEGYSYKKIADLYCCSWGTVYHRLYPFVEHKGDKK